MATSKSLSLSLLKPRDALKRHCAVKPHKFVAGHWLNITGIETLKILSRSLLDEGQWGPIHGGRHADKKGVFKGRCVSSRGASGLVPSICDARWPRRGGLEGSGTQRTRWQGRRAAGSQGRANNIIGGVKSRRPPSSLMKHQHDLKHWGRFFFHCGESEIFKYEQRRMIGKVFFFFFTFKNMIKGLLEFTYILFIYI